MYAIVKQKEHEAFYAMGKGGSSVGDSGDAFFDCEMM
jgi:hypothetical protein